MDQLIYDIGLSCDHIMDSYYRPHILFAPKIVQRKYTKSLMSFHEKSTFGNARRTTRLWSLHTTIIICVSHIISILINYSRRYVKYNISYSNNIANKVTREIINRGPIPRSRSLRTTIHNYYSGRLSKPVSRHVISPQRYFIWSGSDTTIIWIVSYQDYISQSSATNDFEIDASEFNVIDNASSSNKKRIYIYICIYMYI